MKRFKWPLQRLLDVTLQRERALRAELFALARRLARLRQEIAVVAADIRAMLAEIGKGGIDRRIARQEVFMAAVANDERRIAKLDGRLTETRAARDEKTQRFLKTKASREMLQRLAHEARVRYMKELDRLEQKETDESAVVGFVRRAS